MYVTIHSVNDINLTDVERQSALLAQQKRIEMDNKQRMEAEKQQRVAMEVNKRVEEGRRKMAEALELRRREDERMHALELSKKKKEDETTKQALLGYQRDTTQVVQSRLPSLPSSQHHSPFTTIASTENATVTSATIHPSSVANSSVMNHSNSAIAVNVSKARKVNYL